MNMPALCLWRPTELNRVSPSSVVIKFSFKSCIKLNSAMEISSPKPASSVADQPAKRKRNLPGMPDPDAEVIALSPKTLLATNRFVCEICNKGFQRDQNLQLHRRGHNLPWKLKQKSSNEVIRKRVYVCPESSCIHHDPSRALGDLTGIKKHFCRKHGEKKYDCERCSKKYAVQSDWKAHMKTCGTREYRCDCGTLFSRRDSFITHRAFCDVLARENAPPCAVSSPPPPPLTPSNGVLSPVLSVQSSAELPDNQTAHLQPPPPLPATTVSSTSTVTASSSAGLCQSSYSSSLLCAMAGSDHPAIDPMSLSLSSSLYGRSSLFPSSSQNPGAHYASSALSATALLQKAAEMGATSSNTSFLHGLWLGSNTQDNAPYSTPSHANDNGVKLECDSLASGLGLGLPSGGSSGFNEYMMSSSSVFGSKPTTLDLFGLGMGPSEASSGGYSAFLSSIGGGLGMAAAASIGGVSPAGDTWDEPSERKPSIL